MTRHHISKFCYDWSRIFLGPRIKPTFLKHNNTPKAVTNDDNDIIIKYSPIKVLRQEIALTNFAIIDVKLWIGPIKSKIPKKTFL